MITKPKTKKEKELYERMMNYPSDEVRECKFVSLCSRIEMTSFIEKYIKQLHKKYKTTGKQTFHIVVEYIEKEKFIKLSAIVTKLDGTITNFEKFTAYSPY